MSPGRDRFKLIVYLNKCTLDLFANAAFSTVLTEMSLVMDSGILPYMNIRITAEQTVILHSGT